MRDLANFDSRTSTTPVTRSTSGWSRRITSPMRIPVTASNPITVANVSASSGGRIETRA